MIMLDFEIDNDWQMPQEHAYQITLMDVHYKLVPGDIIFLVNDLDFSANWKWIPLIDAAIALKLVANDPEKYRVFEFTESLERIFFKKNDATMQITTSYAEGRASVSIREFRTAVDEFVRSLLEAIRSRFPKLLMSLAVRQELSAAGINPPM